MALNLKDVHAAVEEAARAHLAEQRRPVTKSSTATEALDLRLLTDTAAWDALAPVWNDAARRARAFYLGHAWLRGWWNSYGEGELAVAAVFRGDRLVGFAPCRRQRRWWWGLRVQRVENLFNAHAGRSDFLLEDASHETLALILDALDREPWDVMLLREVPACSTLLAVLPAVAARCGLRVHSRPSLDSPVLTIRGSWEEYLRGRSRNFRATLRRKLKALDGAGLPWRVDCLADAAAVHAGLAEVMDLALRSWSGARGSSIASPPHRSFYEPMLEALAEQGCLRLWTLRIGGRLAAFNICVAWGREIALLKTSYDPAFAQLSPGAVLQAQSVEAIFRSGDFDRYDFLGKQDHYKQRWTEQSEAHMDVFVFNASPLSRTLEVLEFDVRPRLGALKRHALALFGGAQSLIREAQSPAISGEHCRRRREQWTL